MGTDLSSELSAFSTLGWVSSVRPQKGVSGDSPLPHTGSERRCPCLEHGACAHACIASVCAHARVCTLVPMYVRVSVHAHASLCPCACVCVCTCGFACENSFPSTTCGSPRPLLEPEVTLELRTQHLPEMGLGWGHEGTMKDWNSGAARFESCLCLFLSRRLWFEHSRP